MADPVRDFAGTEDGEWATSMGDFQVVAGAEAPPQGIRCRLGLFLGECYLDEGAGTDYHGKVFIKNADPLEIGAELARSIADTPDVTQVVGADLLQDGREASISYAAGTVYSTQAITDFVRVPE